MLCPEPAHAPTAWERPKYEVADIFRAHGELYRQRHPLSGDQLSAMRAIETCRTQVLGGHMDVCDGCGYERPAYNSCRNRHCPKCQALTQAIWIEQRMHRVLPTHYFHVVFTLPAQLRTLCQRNAEIFYDVLFETVSKTLLTLAKDPRRLGAQIGFTAVLHTWTRALAYHPHIHCIVTGGGLTLDGERWISARRKYLFPVKVLSRLFRGKFIARLRGLHDRGKLDTGDLCDPAVFRELVDQLHQHDWVVYAKRPFGGPDQVYRYLGRYTHRVGISNHRILSFDGASICLRTRGDGSVTLSTEEFIRRFLQHVLPSGFVKIRHFGLMASGNAKKKLPVARQLLEPDAPPAVDDDSARDDTVDWRERFKELTGVDLTVCPSCQAGKMIRQPLLFIEAPDTS